MMKKLLLLVSILFFVLFSTNIKAQVSLVIIDSVVVTDDIDCYGELAELTLYVDNDTNSLGCLPNCGPLISYQAKGFYQNGLNVQGAFSSTVTTAQTVPVTNLNVGTYYVLLVDSVAFAAAFPLQFFGPFTTPFSNVVIHPSVYAYDSITFIEPLELANTTTQIDFNQCFGDCDASQEIAISGGTLPYSIDGANISSNADTLTNLCANTYSFVVSDANGCSTSSSSLSLFTITEPNPLSISGSVSSDFNGQDISCFGATDGEVTLTASGGTGNVEYSIDGTTWVSTSVFSNLSSGTYTFYAKDANDCQNDTTITLTDPLNLTGTISVSSPILCYGGIGSISISTNGGTPGGFSYFLNGVNQGSSSFNVPGNQFNTITIEDVNSCTFSDSIFLSEPAAITFNSDVSSESIYNGFGVSCNGLSDGEIAFSNVVGGTTPFTFSIDNGSTFLLDSVFDNLSAGTYDLQLLDDNSCTASTIQLTVTEPQLFTANAVEGSSVSCYGLSDGTLTVTVNNEPSLLTILEYEISGGGAPQINNPTFTSLSGAITYGDYFITVTDANNCIAYDTIAISEPFDWIYSMDSLPEYCGSGLGSATITVDNSTGTAPYSYLWSDGQTTLTADSLVTAIYSVTVTDDNGCSFSENVFIDEADLTLTFDTVAACNNALNASLTALPNGTAPYNYLWSTGETTATINNLSSLTSYFVSITDNNGCIIDSTVLTPESAIVNLQIDYVNSELIVNCYGDPSSGIEVIASGGTGANTYQYFIPYLYPVPQNTGVYVGLFAGTYSLHTFDGNGCSDSTNVIITEPSELNSFIITADSLISCNGGSNGAVSVSGTIGGANPLGGTAPYTFNWSNGSNTEYATNLSAGSYTLDITDDNGCTANEVIVLTEPSLLQTTANVISNSYCAGSQTLASGEVEVLASGATPNYTYLWSNGATTSNAGFLLPGVYTVLVTDDNGCSIPADTAEVLAGENPSILTTSEDITCFGADDGIITPSATGGSTPYQFSNNGGSTYFSAGNVFSNLDQGFYFVSVVDSLGCLDIDSVYIQEPDLLDIDNITTTNVSCYGLNDGELTAAVVGGRTPYTYLWSDGQTTSTASGLSPGNYSISVTDSSGCIATSSATITEPDTLEIIAISSDSALCNGQADGSVTVTVIGGTPTYYYNWSFGGTSANTNAPGGNHTIDVTDVNGCLATSGITVEQPNPIIATYTKDSVSCVGLSDGFAVVSVTGGTGDYSYLWNNGSDSISAYDLNAGYHHVTITDENNCNKLDSVEIYEPPYSVSLDSLITSDITCYSANNGSITVYASGGIGIEYIKSDGLNNLRQPSNIFNSIAPNQYTMYAVDFKGCIDSATILMTQPDSLYIDTTIFSHVQCFGLHNGSIQTISAMGGTGIYHYSVNGGLLYPNTGYFNNYSAGTYTVEVFDENNCVAQDIIIIEEPPVLSVNITTSLWNNYEIQCHGDNSGTANFVISGGATPYTKTCVENGDTLASSFSSTISSLNSGTYNFIVQDNYGCVYIENITYNEPDTILHSFVATHVTCDGWNNGSLTDVVSGGVGNPTTYSYLWNTGDATYSLNNLSIGSYGMTVTDENGCSNYDYAIINDNDKLVASIDSALSSHVTCYDYCDGLIALDITGGIPNVNPNGSLVYSYQWNDTLQQTTVNAVGLCVNNNTNTTLYSCVISDSQGCYDTVEFNLTQPEELVVTASISSPIACFGDSDGKLVASAQGGNTIAPYNYLWNNGVLTSINDLVIAGSYVVVATDDKGCTDTTEILLTEPTVLSVSVVESDESCYGFNDGEITATVTGGTPEPGIPPTYFYLWDDINAQTTATASSLSPNIYSVTVTDLNGCTVTSQTVNISGPTNELVVNADSTDETCLLDDGSAQVFVLGGVPNYSFSWTGPAGYTNSTASISALSPGVYTVNVIDDNGCEVSSTTTVNGVRNILLPGNLSLLDTTICLGTTITLDVQQKSGLSYLWDDASTLADRVVTPTEAINNYYLTITDPNCLNSYSVEAIVRVTYVNTMMSSNPSADPGSNPTIKLNDEITLSSDNNNCDSYLWSNGEAYSSISVVPTQSQWYSVMVDSSGCLGIDSIYVVIGVVPYDAISPNYDGMNDVWEIMDIENYPAATVKVFNRWGEIVHQCSGGNAYVAWDGTYESELLPVGTYYYVIDLNNNEEAQTGPITIIR